MRTSKQNLPQYRDNFRQFADEMSLFLESFQSDVVEDIKLTQNVWEDLRFPVSAVKVNKDKPPTATAYKSSEVYAFSDELVANEQSISFSAQLPHAYKQGSNIEIHIHWVPEDNTAGNVYWELSYSWANIDSAFPAATVTYLTAACDTVTDQHQVDSFGYIDGSGKKISSMLLCTIKRKSSDATDTYNGKSAYFIEADIHYEVDSSGSRNVWTK